LREIIDSSVHVLDTALHDAYGLAASDVVELAQGLVEGCNPCRQLLDLLAELCGHRVELSATGSQAREALDHVVALRTDVLQQDAGRIARRILADGAVPAVVVPRDPQRNVLHKHRTAHVLTPHPCPDNSGPSLVHRVVTRWRASARVRDYLP